jgi:hypothetical protein
MLSPKKLDEKSVDKPPQPYSHSSTQAVLIMWESQMVIHLNWQWDNPLLFLFD